MNGCLRKVCRNSLTNIFKSCCQTSHWLVTRSLEAWNVSRGSVELQSMPSLRRVNCTRVFLLLLSRYTTFYFHRNFGNLGGLARLDQSGTGKDETKVVLSRELLVLGPSQNPQFPQKLNASTRLVFLGTLFACLSSLRSSPGQV